MRWFRPERIFVLLRRTRFGSNRAKAPRRNSGKAQEIVPANGGHRHRECLPCRKKSPESLAKIQLGQKFAIRLPLPKPECDYCQIHWQQDKGEKQVDPVQPYQYTDG